MQIINNFKKITALIMLPFILGLFLFPVYSFADQKNSGSTGIVYVCQDANGTEGNCDFNDFINAIKHIVNFVVINIIFPLTVVVIAYAGYLYMTSGDKPNERTRANKMLTNVVIGIAVILGAWLIVKLITDALLDPNINLIFFK